MPPDPKHERRAREFMSTLLGATIFRADGEVTNDLTALLAAVAAEARAEAEGERDAALKDGFLAGLDRAAELIAQHSCVSSCCDAQPSAGEAAQLARCIRKQKETKP